MRARAASADATRTSILEAARAQFFTTHFDDVTLQKVADDAGVALKTVMRRFGSKEELLLECARELGDDEFAAREVPVGDVAAAAKILAERYDAHSPAIVRLQSLEDRNPAIAAVIAGGRLGHRKWLERIFAPHLPAKGHLREQRVAELFAVTEILLWHVMRHRLGLSAEMAEAAMADMLFALVERWKRGEEKR
jgi:AcrR family transcriptional regulator